MSITIRPPKQKKEQPQVVQAPVVVEKIVTPVTFIKKEKLVVAEQPIEVTTELKE